MRTRGRRRAFPRPAHVTSGARGRAGRAGSAGRLCARCRTRLPLPLDPRSAPYSRADCPALGLTLPRPWRLHRRLQAEGEAQCGATHIHAVPP
ncbi:hypothetical protein VULLAG_LOCUS22386 [Vulpes lagopus]